MAQIELTYVPIKCGIVNPYVDGFVNNSGNALLAKGPNYAIASR